jgi:hypothetical protein
LQEHGFHRVYERTNHPFSSPNDSFTLRHRFVFPEPEDDMPKIVLRYDLQTLRQQSKTLQAVKVSINYWLVINRFLVERTEIH